MPILPVLDVMHGQVVRGIAGQRDQYQPRVSRLTESSVPCDVARALHERFGFQEFYLADLDAIQGAGHALKVYEDLAAAGYRLWLDAGVRTVQDVAEVLLPTVATVIVG